MVRSEEMLFKMSCGLVLRNIEWLWGIDDVFVPLLLSCDNKWNNMLFEI